MLKAYFVTEMDKFDIIASSLVNAYYNGDYLKKAEEKIKKIYPMYDWQIVKLGQLYEQLDSNSCEALIILAKNAAPYKHAIKNKYPEAKVLLSDNLSE